MPDIFQNAEEFDSWFDFSADVEAGQAQRAAVRFFSMYIAACCIVYKFV